MNVLVGEPCLLQDVDVSLRMLCVCENDGSSCPLLYIVALWKPSNPQKGHSQSTGPKQQPQRLNISTSVSVGFRIGALCTIAHPFQLKIPNNTAFGLLYLDQTVKNVSHTSGRIEEV